MNNLLFDKLKDFPKQLYPTAADQIFHNKE